MEFEKYIAFIRQVYKGNQEAIDTIQKHDFSLKKKVEIKKKLLQERKNEAQRQRNFEIKANLFKSWADPWECQPEDLEPEVKKPFASFINQERTLNGNEAFCSQENNQELKTTTLRLQKEKSDEEQDFGMIQMVSSPFGFNEEDIPNLLENKPQEAPRNVSENSNHQKDSEENKEEDKKVLGVAAEVRSVPGNQPTQVNQKRKTSDGAFICFTEESLDSSLFMEIERRPETSRNEQPQPLKENNSQKEEETQRSNKGGALNGFVANTKTPTISADDNMASNRNVFFVKSNFMDKTKRKRFGIPEQLRPYTIRAVKEFQMIELNARAWQKQRLEMIETQKMVFEDAFNKDLPQIEVKIPKDDQESIAAFLEEW